MAISPGKNLTAQDNFRLELLHANQLENVTRNGISTKRLVGNVKFRRGEAILTCDIAEFDEKQDETRLNGHVRVTQGEAVLTGDNGIYDGKLDVLSILGHARYQHRDQLMLAQRLKYDMNHKIAIAEGRPVLRDSTRTLTARKVTFYENQRYGHAEGKSTLNDLVNRVTVSGERILFYPDQDSLLATGRPEVSRNDSAGGASFIIRADSLSLESDFFFAWGHVVITHHDVTGVSGQAVFQRTENYAIMRQAPQLSQGAYQLKGDVIQLNLKNDELRSVFIPTNPIFIDDKTLGDTVLTDELTGKQMVVELEDNKVQSVTLEGMATSFFHVVEDSVYRGLNLVSGDTLTILMADDEVNEIQVIGGTQGTYTPAAGSGLEGKITYQSDHIRYSIPRQSTTLSTAAKVNYQDMGITAGEIDVDWRRNLLEAHSQTDTVGAADYPELKQKGEEPLKGVKMLYNMRQDRGQVTAGRTQFEQGFYYGENMKRIASDEYHIVDGYYTTCDIPDHPHYYFYSKRMKLITDRIVIAKPVWLYIADVPVAWLPFAVFPQQRGHQSGFLMPAYDYKKSEGRSLKGLGYYWAISDYMDAKLNVDFYDKNEDFLYRGAIRYKIRNVLNGAITGSITPDRTGKTHGYRWDLRFNHSHTIDPTLSITGSGQLTGDANYSREYYQDLNARLQKKLVSNLSVRKRFEGTRNSMSMNLNYTRDLQVGQLIQKTPASAGIKYTESTLSLPDISFNRSSSAIIAPQPNEPEHWYNKILFSYGTTFKNPTTNAYQSFALDDTVLYWRKESISRKIWTHNMSLSSNTSLGGSLSLSGGVNYREGWAFKYEQPRLINQILQYDTSGNIIREPVKGFLRRGTFSSSIALSTNLYGLFPLNLGSLKSVRHVMSPSLRLSYAPNFSDPQWGYVKTYRDSVGHAVKFDPYKYSSLGGTGSSRAMNLNWAVNNELDYKWLPAAQTVEEAVEKKAKFFTFNFRGSYDVTKDSLRASNISGGGNLFLGSLGSVNYSTIFQVYDRVPNPNSPGSTMPVNRLRIPRMKSASIGFSYLLSSRTQVAQADTADTTVQAENFQDTRFENRAATENSNRLWNMQLNFSYTFSQTDPAKLPTRNFWMQTNTRMNLTKYWHLSYRARFDLVNQQLVSHGLSIDRDLHCWSLKFTWTPSGYAAGYYLLIQVKASQLKDLKLQHRSQPFRY